MITLTGMREIARCNVCRDDLDALSWYMMPQSPRIALDDNDKPLLSLVWYRRDVSQLTEEERRTKLGGGILTLSVELSATDDDVREIRKTIAADPALHQRLERSSGRGPDYRNWWLNEIRKDQTKLAEALKLNTVPIMDGTVGISVLAESPAAGQAGEFVANLVGVGRVSMTGRQRAAFTAKLTQDGAVLLWEMLERELPAIRVQYDLKFYHRLDAVTMIVWCDARKAYHAIQDQWHQLTDDASWTERHSGNSSWYTFSHDEVDNARNRMFTAATASETTRIEIIPEAGGDVLPPEQIADLTRIGNEMVKDFLTATFLEAKPGEDFEFEDATPVTTELARQNGKEYGHHGIKQYNLKTLDESMNATLDYKFKSQAVVEGHLGPQDNLANVLGGRRVEEFRTQIEIDAAWYRYLDVQVACTADFAEDPVDLVKAHLSYDARGAQGDIHSVKDLVFKKDTPPQRFATYLASPEQRTYDFEYEVFYKGSTLSYSAKGKSDETVLVLDTDRLGILRVDVQLGLVDWERIRSVFVKMWYGQGPERKETEFTLDAQRQSFRWTEVIARELSEPYAYQLVFVDKNNQRIVLDPTTSRSKQLVINQPLGEDLEVVIVPAGSFGAGGLLQQVVVAVRYQDKPNDYLADDVFTLSKEGESRVWKVPLIDKKARGYEYRVTVLYSDGVTREDDWRKTDKTILPVGDPFGYRVQISPYLLKNPPGVYQFGTIHLSFEDAEAGIRAEKDLEITDFTKPLVWRFRLGSPERHSYRYELSLFRADGQEVRVPPTESSKEVLVLVPPAVN